MSGAVVSHDGNTWTLQPGDAISVSAGSDGSVFSIGFKNNRQLSQWTGSNWNAVAQHASALSQVAVGDQSRVWLRDSGNVVHQLQQGQLQPAPLLGARAHLAANTDGTVWSCTGSDSNADRFISEATATPQSIPIQAQATVHKVASTGFGTAHCLVQQDGTPQLYRYQSPYLFKTSETYQVVTPNTIDAGLGSIYFTVATGPGGNSGPYYVVALDAHTGQELSRSAPGSSAYTPPVFDARHDVVIVGAGNQMLGLDARDLTQVRWALTPQADTGPMSIGPARPTLRGQLLALTDNIATVALYQLGATADAAPTKLWSSSMAIAPQDTHQLAPPVIAGGNVYAAWWVRATIDGYQQLWLFAFDAASGAATRTKLDPTFGYDTSQFHSLGMFTPVLVEVPASQSGAAHVYLLVNGGGSAWRVDVASPDATQKYGLPGSNYITSGFSVANGVVWFGDNAASLYGVDVNQLKAVANTPQSYSPAGETQPIYTTPVVYQDPLGDEVVLVSAFNPSAPTASGTGLVAFSPSTGTTATIPAGTTALSTLSPAVINGVIYAAGYNGLSNGATALPSQVFAIRVDQAVQDLRDFIIDSQLMQDFDGASTPNGVARYQTHLTLVDDTKAPIPNEPIKLWADQSTHISVGGQNYSVGPADEQYAALKTAADGTLTIVSDAADMWTPPLRVWAAFMDPFERIMIYRDREFHNRVATAHAANDGQNGAADPTRVNLQAVTTYGAIQKGGVSGPELFTADQKTHNQPQQVANAIQTMTKSVGTSKGSGGSTPKAAWSLHTTLDTAKYIPYADLPGSQYSAVNTPAVRPVVVLQTAGLSYAKADDNADTQPALTALTPAAATLAIDALQGAEWTSSSLASPRVTVAARAGALHLGSWFSDFWDWVKGAAATITHVVVSVAEDIYTGIRVLVDGVAHVFRAIITGLEEAVSAIGAFFVELGHLIEDVIEALSILFHFEEIIKTHNILKSELLSRVNTFPTTVSGSVVPALNTFFNTSEQEIAGYLNGWADKIAGSPGGSGPPVTTLKGSGATAHSTFTVSPSGGGQSSSHAVQSTWGLRKLNGAIGIDGAASLSTALAQSPGAGGTVSDFFTGFAARLSGDGNLSAQWAKVQAGANGLAHPSSAADFVKQSLAELLRTLALILDGAVSVGAAFLIGDNGAGGLLGLIGTLLEQMVGDGGLLTTDPQIPVLSWLYQELFGEPLTFVNALLLVAAIPVTVLWKVVKGQWPSESLPQSTAATAVAGGLQTPPPLLAELIGITGGVLSVVLGFVYGAGDILGADPDVPLVLGRMALAGSLLAMACSFPLASNNSPSYYDWYGWGIGLGIALLNIVGSVNNPEPLATQITYVFPLILSVSNLLLAAVLGVVVAQEYPDADPLAKASVVISLMATLPGLANPLKLVDELLAIVVAALDVVMGFASGSVQLAGAFT